MEEQNQQYLKQELPRTELEGTTVGVKSRLKASRIIRLKRTLKILPMIMAGLYWINTVLSYFDLDYNFVSYLAGVGLIPLIFIFIASYAFNFCNYHRMFLWYIVANDIICWADYNFELPISNWKYMMLHCIVAGVFLGLILYMRQKCRKKS